MNELDKLRPEVRDALQVFDGEAVCTCHPAYTSRGLKDPQCNHDLQESVDIIRAELLRLAMIETDALIALDCEHDWQVEHERAEKAEAELLRLAADRRRADVIRDSYMTQLTQTQLERGDAIQRAEKAEAELATAQNTINAQQDTIGALKQKLALSEGELAALKQAQRTTS